MLWWSALRLTTPSGNECALVAEGRQISPQRGVADAESKGEIGYARRCAFDSGLIYEPANSMAATRNGIQNLEVTRVAYRPSDLGRVVFPEASAERYVVTREPHVDLLWKEPLSGARNGSVDWDP